MKSNNVILSLGIFIFLNNFYQIDSGLFNKFMDVGADILGIQEEKCKEGWLHFENNCYLFIKEEKTWQEAKTTCKRKKSQLVSIVSKSENSYLKGEMKKDFWTSGTDAVNEGDWRWANGKKIKYKKWAYGEPNNQKKEDCMVVNYHNGKWNDIPCQASRSFICQYSEDDAEDLEEDNNCPEGWSHYDDNCYLFINEEKKWEDAKSTCTGERSHLVSIANKKQNTYLTETMNKDFWTSGTDAINEGKWKWANGKKIKYTQWNYGEPNNLGNEDCMFVYYPEGNWNDVPCSISKSFICQYSKDDHVEDSGGVITNLLNDINVGIFGNTDEECREGWSYFDNNCYLFIDKEKTWIDAKSTCREERSHLVSIFSKSQNSYLTEKMNYGFWTSGTDAVNEGSWYWANGNRIKYKNWAVGEPNNLGKEDCLGVSYPNGKWNDLPCGITNRFICQYPGEEGFEGSGEAIGNEILGVDIFKW